MMKLQPRAMNAMTARISTAKMTKSMPRVMEMPRMFTKVLKATNTMTHRYHGLFGTSMVPQLATMTYSRAGVMQ